MNPSSPAVFSDSHNSTIKHQLKIDKLTLLHDLPENEKKDALGYFKGLIADTDLHSQSGITRSYSSGCRGYEVSLDGKIPLSESPLIWSQKSGYLLQVGPKKAQKPFLRLDINPEGLTAVGMAHLQSHLDHAFGIPWPTWRFARVSRIDIAADFHGVDLTNWVWDIPKRSSRELFCRQGELRTLYLGAKRGAPLVIYNKAKQNPAMAGNGTLTRVEYRAKNAGPLLDLADLANPLQNVIVFDPSKLAYPDPHKIALRALGHQLGRRGILQSFPATCRNAVDIALMKTNASWWDPAEIWKSWRQCLEETLPSIYGKSGQLPASALAYVQAMKAQAGSGAAAWA